MKKEGGIGLEVEGDGSSVKRLVERLSRKFSLWKEERFGNGAWWKRRGGDDGMGWVKGRLAVVEVAGAMNVGSMELLWRQVLARPLEMNAVPEIRPINVPLSR